MILTIIAVLLTFAAGTFMTASPSEEAGRSSEVTTLSQAGEDANFSGRPSITPVKLPIVLREIAGLSSPLAQRLHIERDGGHWMRQFACSQERGRAPPVPAAI